MKFNRITFVFVLVGAAFLIALFQEPVNNPGRLQFKASGDVAYGYGTSNSKSLDDMRRFLNENPDVKTLVLTMMPGTQDADLNIRIARLIRRRGLNTHLRADSRIASGAVDLFLAGNERTMECGAQIGVHSWSSSLGYAPGEVGWDERQRYHETFLRDMGIDPEFYVFTREAAPPEGIYILTPEDINRFDLLSEPLNCNG